MKNILRPAPLRIGEMQIEFYRESNTLVVLTFSHSEDKDPGYLCLPVPKLTLTVTLRAIGPVNFMGIRLEGYFLIPHNDESRDLAKCLGLSRIPEICFVVPPLDLKDKVLSERGRRERADFGPPVKTIGKRFKVAFGSHADGGAIINPAD